MLDFCSRTDGSQTHVGIYGEKHHVTYPSHKHVDELLREVTTLKSGSDRRWFVCIQCGDDKISNKMMLNKQRFLKGCP